MPAKSKDVTQSIGSADAKTSWIWIDGRGPHEPSWRGVAHLARKGVGQKGPFIYYRLTYDTATYRATICPTLRQFCRYPPTDHAQTVDRCLDGKKKLVLFAYSYRKNDQFFA